MINSFPIGWRLLWKQEDQIPEGFVIVGTVSRVLEHEEFAYPREELKDLLIIEQVDNLTYIERLAKQKGLV